MPRYRSQTSLVTAGRSGIHSGTSAPSPAHVGQRWFNTATAVTYQYTRDAAGTKFWLDISSGGIGTSAGRGVDFVGDTDPIATTNLGVVGSVYYNREKNRHFVCTTATTNSQVWSGRYNGTGGTVTDYAGYRVHTFSTSDSTQSSYTFTLEEITTCDILVIAGGGQGAGNEGGGGGGAGGFKYWSQTSVAKGSHAVTVGAGGSVIISGGASWRGQNGYNSQFGSLSACTGGGGGGAHNGNPATTEMNGGSGAGGTGRAGSPGGTGMTNQGNAGGAAAPNAGPGDADGGGGGGGAGGAGTGGQANQGGNGGVGYTEGATVYDWESGSGTVTFPAAFKNGASNSSYAGGGGGGTENPGTNSTASHGGGADAATINGTAGTGGGGGGKNGSAGTPGSGGSGIVIVRYAI